MSEPRALDTERANPARMYDYYLGGCHNFEADRAAARAAEIAWPGTARCAQANRSFLRRAVRYLAGQGVDQFLDLGSGVPTVGNVHQILREANPEAKVVYVDNEPVAVKASEALLADEPNAVVLQADLRDPSAVLDHVRAGGLIDLNRPIAVMLVSVLMFVPDADQPGEIVRSYLDAVAPGSHLTISHYCYREATPARDVEAITGVYNATTNPFTLRSMAEIAALFDGTELVEPGLTHVLDWRPDGDKSLEPYRDRISLFAAIGRKP